MAGFYLYAITGRPGAHPPSVSGLEDGHPFDVCHRDIAAVLGAVASEGIPPTPSNLWRHEHVIEALMTDRTALPARFGTVLSDEAKAQAMLTARHAEFAADLDRLRGCVEMGLRVLWVQPPIDVSSVARNLCGERRQASGRSYLEARLGEWRQREVVKGRAEEMAARVHAPLRRLALDSRERVLATRRLLLTAAYLVEKDKVGVFGSEVDALAPGFSALRLLCTGPWPPYSFVTVSSSAKA